MIVTKNEKIVMKVLEYDKFNNVKKAELIVSYGKNYPGILHKITGVLYVNGWSILSAKINSHEGLIEDIFVIENVDNNKVDSSHIEKME